MTEYDKSLMKAVDAFGKPSMRKYEVRFRVPYNDREQNVYGFKKKDVEFAGNLDSANAIKFLPFNAFDLHIQEVPNGIK